MTPPQLQFYPRLRFSDMLYCTTKCYFEENYGGIYLGA